MKLYNTLTRKKEEFVPVKGAKSKEVSMYCCGPTVYNYAHIGNLRSYIFEDVLKRVLTINNFKVNHVMNITDVGHLTSDADEGEDKLLKGARREKKTVWEVADFYVKAFKNDIKELNILFPQKFPKATEHIKEQIELIKKLEKKGFTYQAGGNVYFDSSKLKDYGKLARLNLEEKGKARVEKDENKKNSHDFVLWFTKSKFKDQEMKWDSPFGTGYPGWHLECSAMSMKYLGEQFDIHCGGIDHIPVHHTNEIAQSEAVTGKKPWVKYWLHNEFLVLKKGEKMAKSGENFVTLSTLKEKGFNPLDYRYFCLGTVYRKPLMFDYEALESAKNARERLVERVFELKAEVGKSGKKSEKKIEKFSTAGNKYQKQFLEQVSDDLNTPKALATMWDMFKDDSVDNVEKLCLLYYFDQVFGLNLEKVKEEKVPAEILKLAKEREKARKAKDWEKSDQLREKINKKGYFINDTKDGFRVKKT